MQWLLHSNLLTNQLFVEIVLAHFAWNDRRWCRVFLCFYFIILQHKECKISNFCLFLEKVGQQFQNNKMFVCITFRHNRSRNSGFMALTPTKVWRKRGRIQKIRKNISHVKTVYLKIPFHLHQLTVGC